MYDKNYQFIYKKFINTIISFFLFIFFLIIISKILYSIYRVKKINNLESIPIKNITLRKTSDDTYQNKWLTSAIIVGEATFNYVNLAKKTNGDFCLETSSYPGNRDRYFYCLDSEGKYLFKDENDIETPYYHYVSTEIERFDAELSSIIYNDKDYIDERFISLGLDASYTEIYDFSSNLTQIKETSYFTHSPVNTTVSNAITINISGKYYLFFCFLSIDSSQKKFFVFIRFYFSKLGDEYRVITTIDSGNKNMASFFITDNNVLVCFYTNTDNNYYVKIFDVDLNETGTYEISSIEKDDPNLFYKSIHLKSEIGVFSYYINNEEEESKPYIQIKNFCKQNNGDISMSNYISKDVIIIDKSLFNYNVKLNDLIKLSDDKFALISCSKDRKKLLIVLFNIYTYENNLRLGIKYFEINIFENYSIRFYAEIKSILFRDFIAIGYSFCSQEECEYSTNNPHSSLLILNYPNSTDIFLNAIKDFQMQESTSFNVSELCKIENNLFNYRISRICLYYNSNYINIIIKMPINSGECFQFNNGFNELIKIYYNNTEIKNNIIIKYNLEIEEPEYNQYIKNLEIIDIYSDNITEEDSFEPRTFKDKTKKIIICIDPDCPEETELTENINIASSIITYPIKTTINNIPIVIPTYSQINKCSEEDILNNLCYENLDEKQLERICNIIREKIVNNNITYNTIIQTKNAVIQVATVNITKYQNNPNVSNLDLGECEEILKKEYGLTKDLLIFKLDIKFNNSSKIYVQYEVYDSDKKIKLDINKCKGHQITISLPAQLGSDIVSLYNDMSEYGYNLFNDSDSFYNDICTLYKSKNGTDILLTDRQDIYLNNEKNNYCQSNCDFVSYNSNTLKENCD